MGTLVEIDLPVLCIYVIELHPVTHFIWLPNKYVFTGLIDAK